MLSSTDIRRIFFDYFKKNNHTFIPSSSVVPYDDPSLIFCNAGMNQFKTVFNQSLTSYQDTIKTAYNSQKCIRAGVSIMIWMM